MPEQPSADPSGTKPETAALPARDAAAAAAQPVTTGESTIVPPTAAPPANQLTPEEQMALFEKELKETDWGHQPC